MTLEELQQLISGDYGAAVDSIIKLKPVKEKEIADVLKELEPGSHAVMDKTKRPDKTVTIEDEEDPTKNTTRIEPVSRLPIPFQKRIVDTAAAFLCGNPIKIEATPTDEAQKGLLATIQRTWEDNKLDYESMGLASMMMGETECAELWYQTDVEPEYWIGSPNEGAKVRYRFITLAPSKGDTLYPVFDSSGDMIGFGRAYSVQEGENKIEHFDFYTDAKIILGVKQEGNWVSEVKPNIIKKIPVIYYSQPLPEWNDVQALIERMETSLSNNADTNDYFGSPILTIAGAVKGLSAKGEQGKVVELENGATAAYLTWQNAPEAVKMENENLQKFIYSMTATPDISFEQMKSLGVFSGIALRLLFMDAHMKAARKEGIFGKGIQRRINYLKAAITTANIAKFGKVKHLDIKPVFEYFLPKNIEEAINILTAATGSGKAVMSQATAVKLNPLVSDAEAEMEIMQEEGVMGSDIEVA